MHEILRLVRKNGFDSNLISNMHDCIPFANPNKSKLSHGKVDKVQSYWHPVSNKGFQSIRINNSNAHTKENITSNLKLQRNRQYLL